MRRLFLILYALSAITLNATNDDGGGIFAENIQYDYEMTYDENSGRPDCKGTLSFSIKLPPNAVSGLIRRSRPHRIPSTPIAITEASNLVIKEGESILNYNSTNDFSWGVYFEILVKDTDGKIRRTPRYCTSDYMSPDDLQEIMDWASSIGEIPANEFEITRDAVNLIVDAESEGSLSIFSTEGKRLFYDQNKSRFEIPLAVLKSQIIIARFTCNNETKTQKILLK